jgi:hypothetical protein
MGNRNTASSFQVVAATTAMATAKTASLISALRFRGITAAAAVMLAIHARWTTFNSSRSHSLHSKVRRS